MSCECDQPLGPPERTEEVDGTVWWRCGYCGQEGERPDEDETDLCECGHERHSHAESRGACTGAFEAPCSDKCEAFKVAALSVEQLARLRRAYPEIGITAGVQGAMRARIALLEDALRFECENTTVYPSWTRMQRALDPVAERPIPDRFVVPSEMVARDTANDRIEHLRRELAKANDTIRGLEGKLAVALANNDAFRAASDADLRVGLLHQDIDQRDEKIGKLADRIGVLTDERDSASRRGDALAVLLDAANAENARLKTKVDDLNFIDSIEDNAEAEMAATLLMVARDCPEPLQRKRAYELLEKLRPSALKDLSERDRAHLCGAQRRDSSA